MIHGQANKHDKHLSMSNETDYILCCQAVENAPSGDTVCHICCIDALWKAKCVRAVSTVNMALGGEAQLQFPSYT